jgi:hypothetical protein
VKWGRFWGVRRPEPVGGSKVPSTFVLQSTAAARCLRSIPPVRHRASARALVFGERSLGLDAQLWRLAIALTPFVRLGRFLRRTKVSDKV